MRWRILIFLLIAATSAACGKGSSSSSAESTKVASPPSSAAPVGNIKIVRPEYRTRVMTLETSGKVQFNEERIVRVNAPVTGRVLETLARPGDVVDRGRQLLILDSADLGAAKSDYAKAVSDFERSVKALRLARELFEVKAIAEKEIR